MGLIEQYAGFDWDAGNRDKNWIRHKVSRTEIEQVFSNRPWFDYEATGFIGTEKRRIVLGKTDNGRPLFIVYTVRENHIRPISGRDMNKKERDFYDEKVKTDS